MKQRLRGIAAISGIGLALAGLALTAPATAAGSRSGTPTSTLAPHVAIVYFDAGRAVLTPSAQSVLDRVASAHTEGWTLTVTGYVQVASKHANDASLSMARAQAVRHYLRVAGVAGTVRVQGLGVHPVAPSAPSARRATITWVKVVPPAPSASPVASSTPTATASPGPTSTPPAAPLPATCNVEFNPQGGVMAETSTITVAVGTAVQLRSVLYGPGDFAGWFTNPFTGYVTTPETATFVGYGMQTVNVACLAGATVTLYAHWAMPKATAVPATVLTVRDGGMVNYFSNPWSLIPVGTLTRVCEVSAASAPYTEIGCVSFSSTDAVGSTKPLTLSGATAWIVAYTTGVPQSYTSTGVAAWSSQPSVLQIDGRAQPGPITSAITCDANARTLPFQRAAGTTLWVTDDNTC